VDVDLNVRQQIGGIMCRIGDAGFDLSAGNADLVDQLAMFRHEGCFDRLRST